MIRYLLIAALTLCPILDANAACYRDANGNWVCTRPAMGGGTVTRVRSAQPATVTYSAPSYAQSYQTRAVTRYERRGLFGRRLVPVTRYETTPVASTYSSGSYSAVGSSGSDGGYAASKPAAKAEAPPAASSGCNCTDKLKELEHRIEALEAAKYMQGSKQSKAGPPFEWRAKEGPAFAWTPPAEPMATVAMQ